MLTLFLTLHRQVTLGQFITIHWERLGTLVAPGKKLLSCSCLL